MSRDDTQKEAWAKAVWNTIPGWFKAGILISLGGGGSFGAVQLMSPKAEAAEAPASVAAEIMELKASKAVFEERFKGVERRLDSIEQLQMEILKELRRGRLLGSRGEASPLP